MTACEPGVYVQEKSCVIRAAPFHGFRSARQNYARFQGTGRPGPWMDPSGFAPLAPIRWFIDHARLRQGYGREMTCCADHDVSGNIRSPRSYKNSIRSRNRSENFPASRRRTRIDPKRPFLKCKSRLDVIFVLSGPGIFSQQ